MIISGSNKCHVGNKTEGCIVIAGVLRIHTWHLETFTNSFPFSALLTNLNKFLITPQYGLCAPEV